MDVLQQCLNQFFDIVFARDADVVLWQAIIANLAAFSLIYALAVLPSFWFYRRMNTAQLINTREFKAGQLLAELAFSLQSIVMFALLGGVTFLLLQQGSLVVNGDISFQEFLWEVFVLYCWNEIHFYACHRLLHTSWLYRHVHLQHHRSVRVTPLATWRFHWLEALLLGSVLPTALVFYSFSVWSLMMLPLMSIFWNIIGHSNWRSSIPLLGAASYSHARHHSEFHGNYGFSTPLLDRIFRSALPQKV